MLRKLKKARKGWGTPILVEFPSQGDTDLRRFARQKAMTPTATVRMLALEALTGYQKREQEQIPPLMVNT